MSNVTKTFNVYKDMTYTIGMRSFGKEDLVKSFKGQPEETTISRNDMQNYVLNGIEMQPVVGDSKAVIDFSNVKLPWKFEYKDKLLTSRFAIAPLGTTVTQPRYVKDVNAIKVGSPTVSEDFVASGFSSDNYISIPKQIITNNFEMLIKFKTPTSLPSLWGGIAGQITNNKTTPQMEYNIDGKIDCVVATSTSSNWYGADVKFNTALNTWYWVKYVWNNGLAELLYSTNGIDYVSAGTYTVSSINWSEPMAIGKDQSNPFSGSIDLKECYIKINSVEVWSGTHWVATEEMETLQGCIRYYYGEGEHVTTPPRDSTQYYNIYAVNGDEGVVLDSTYYHEGTMVYNRPIVTGGEIPQFENEWYLGEYRVDTGEEGYIYIPIGPIPDTGV